MSLPQAPQAIVDSGKPFSVLATITALPGKADELSAALVIAAAKAVQEPGVLRYLVGREADKRDVFWVTERYESVSAFETHGKAEALSELAGKNLIGGLYLHFIEDL
ncbi:hypothetical protein BDY24DRAFT_402481 [Mrakia frigida]|uniref:putative quinol monooxygenase n=1 Tax=Mrakia frigida TaxID=29902 RepID=UPI003FCC1756